MDGSRGQGDVDDGRYENQCQDAEGNDRLPVRPDGGGILGHRFGPSYGGELLGEHGPERLAL